MWRRMKREVEGLRGREQGEIEDTEGCWDANRNAEQAGRFKGERFL